jgi:hypothetical protein
LSISNFHLDQTILTTNVLEDPDMFLWMMCKTFRGVKNVANNSCKEKSVTHFMFSTLSVQVLWFSVSLNKSHYAYISEYLYSTIVFFWWHLKPKLSVFYYSYASFPSLSWIIRSKLCKEIDS